MEDTLNFGILLLVGGVLVVAVWALFRWSRLKPRLFPPPNVSAPDEINSPAKNVMPENIQWLKDIPAILVGVRRTLEREQVLDVQVPVEAMRKLESAVPQLAIAVRSVITKSLKSAELHSLLARVQGLHAYIVVVPNRHEHPHLIRRYAPFSAGWTHHASLVKASLMASGDFSALICYLFFLSANAKEGLLLVSYADADTELVPSGLMPRSELKLASTRSVDASFEFKMSN